MRIPRQEVLKIMKAQRRRDFTNNPALGRSIVWGQSYPGVQSFDYFGSPDELSAQIIASFEDRKNKLKESWWTIRDLEGRLQFADFKFDMALDALKLAQRSALENYHQTRSYFDYIIAQFFFFLPSGTDPSSLFSWDQWASSFLKNRFNSLSASQKAQGFYNYLSANRDGNYYTKFSYFQNAWGLSWFSKNLSKTQIRTIFTNAVQEWHRQQYAFWNETPASLNFQRRQDLGNFVYRVPEFANNFFNFNFSVSIPSKWSGAQKSYFATIVAGDDYVDKVRDAMMEAINKYFDVWYSFIESIRDGAELENEIKSKKAIFDADAKSLKDFVVKYKDILQGVNPDDVVASILASNRPKVEPVTPVLVLPPPAPVVQPKTDLPVAETAKTVASTGEKKSNTGLIVAGAIAAAAALLMR
jgi:hypothetical protein